MRALLLAFGCLLSFAALLTAFFGWEAIQIEKEGIAAVMEGRFQSEPPECKPNVEVPVFGAIAVECS